MMRRSRISVKPNFRPGNRTGTESEQVSQGVSEAGDTSPAVEAEEVARATPSDQQSVALIEPSEDVAIKDAPEMPSKMIQNDGAHSSGAATSSAAPHRRMRISATPKLVGPKPTSTPQAQPSSRMPSSAPSSLPNEERVQNHDSASEAPASVSIMSNDLPKSGAPRKSTSPTNLSTQSSTTTQSSSPCVPSTSGLQKAPVHEKKSVEDSPPSPQPGQVPQQPPQEPEPPESPSSSDLSSVCIKPSQFDKAGSSEMVEKSSDKDRILRALKLKELMKIERRKDIQMGKRRVGHKEYTALDRSKMTMRDLIYYLPNTSPMRSSVAHEENQEETIIPPSPKQQIKTAEGDEEEEEEEEPENEEMLVPKVRVAEDGSIVLDEESLTVRVQRTSNTKALEGSSALFERGSTTTYSSFRALNYVKSWSVRETDLFFLAISMVGTDFSLIGQLLAHRSRAAIKSKFKKEERLNPWRVDKALRNKRPYDKEFFSYLLEKILAKDKDKRKSVKLILPKTKKPRKSKGKTSSELCVSDDDDDGDDDVFHMDDREDLEDDEDVCVEKENEDVSNVTEADACVPAKKRRKRTRDVSKGKDNSTEGQVKRKRQRKCSKKTTKEAHSRDDTEGERDINVEGDTINVNKEDELERSTSASKRRRKRSQSDEENQNGKPVKGTKGKKLKKSRKVVCDREESVSEHEESSIRDEDGSATKKKRKRAKNSDLDVDEPAKGKKNTKRKKALKIEEEGTAEEGAASADLQEAEQLNAPVTTDVADNVPPKASRRSKKPSPNLATTRSKKSNEPEASAEVERESQDENIHESILTAADSPSEDEKLQMQAVVVLEKTPPRQQNVLSPSKVQCKNNELEPSMSSPASPSSSESSSTQQTRMQRAGRVKCDLSTNGKMGRKTGMMDQDQADPESQMVLLESSQESEGEEDDSSLNENLTNLSCLRDSDSQMFQRRPMVVLSREEVDMFLDASDQSADEDPSVSPLDLSLNTELSFPLQCSKLLEDNDEEGEVDCVFEEHEERINERASCEERNCEELELTESALAQPDISNLRDLSTSLKTEVCSQPEVDLSKVTTPTEEAEPQVHPVACKDVTTVAAVLEGSPYLVVLDNIDPICMKPDVPMTQETVTTETTTLGTSLVVSDVMEESEKAMLPTLLKESALASSEITAQSKLTPTGSGLGSHRSLQAAPEVKGELQKSLAGPSQTLETLQDSSEIEEGTEESAMASPEIKVRTQGCAVAPEVKEDSQEEVSVQSSASVSSEHGIRPTRRSRFLKPKPNLSQKSRVLQNQGQDLKTPSTLKPKSSEPTVSTEKLLYSPATDQHGALEDFSKQNLTKEETSQSNAMDQMESESTKDLSDASTAVPDQENITTVTLSPASADEPQAQPDISNLSDLSTSLKTEVCSQPELDLSKVTTPTEEAEPQVHPVACKDVTTVAAVLEGSPPLVVLDKVDPICMKPDVPMTQETVTTETTTLGTSLVVSDVMEESEKAMLPTLLKESALASSEITAQSKLTPTGSGLGSHRSLQAAPEVKGELQKSLAGPSQTLETLQDSSEIEEGTEESAMASPEIKVRTQGCAVAPEVKEDSQEEVSVQSSASVSSEHGIRPTRRSRFLKPKPNLSQKSRVLQNQGQDLKTPSTLKPKSSEPTVSTEKLLYSPATDQHGALEDFSKQNLTKEETSQSNAMDQMESESTKDLSDASTAVPDQENITTITLSPASADEPQVASESSRSRCDVDMVPPCTSLTSLQPSQTGEDTGGGQMIVPSEDVCAPAEIVPLTEDGDKEPTFILTLYEIPVTQAYLPSSSNDSVMASDLPTFKTQASLGFSDQAHTLQSTSESSSSTALPQDSEDTEQCERVSHMVLADVFVPVSEDTGDDSSKDRTMAVESKEASSVSVTEDLAENVKEHILLDTKDEESDASANLETGIPHMDPDSECKKGSEFAPLEDFASGTQSTPSGFNISKCITTLPQDSEDTEQCERVSHMVLGDVFVPVSEDTRDDSNKDRTMAVESKLQSKEASSVSVTEDLAENVKEQTSSQEHILLDTKDEEIDASANLETGIPHMDPDSECKKRSEFAPLEDLASGTQSTPSGFNISKCITTSLQDSEDTEQCERVSHMVLGDIFVPVSEETGDDSSKDRTMAVECKLHSKEASSVSVTEYLGENVKEQISEHMTSHEPILLDTKDEENDVCVNLETGIPYLDPDSECKKGSEIVPLEDLVSRNQSTPRGFSVSKCIKTLPQDSEDPEQCESVSHMVLGDVFVPVSEETGDDSSEDRTMAVESRLHSKEASSVGVPERQDTPYEELTKVENSPAVSNPLLCFGSTEESKDTPPLSEEKKSPARRRERQIKPQPKLVKRARTKDVSSKTDQLVEEPSQPTSSHVVLPASHEENLAGISNTTDEKSVDRMSSIRGNKTSVSGGKEVKPKSIAEESPKMSQSDSEPTESKPVSAALHLSKDPKLEEENSENATGDITIKDDMESSAEDKELTVLTSNEGENAQPSCEDMSFSLIKSSGSGSSTVDSEETEAEPPDVSHMVLPDVFVLVSDETEDDLCNDLTVSIESSPQRVSLPKKSGAHFQKELKTEAVSQTLIEESTQNQSPLVDIETPVRKRAGKQEVKRTCTKNDLTGTRLSQPTSPQATTPSSQLTNLPRNENMVLLEEKLQRRHHIMPCTVRLSSLDTVAQSLRVPQLGDRKGNDVMSSPTCHASVTNVSEESSTPSLFEEMKLEDPELEKRSPTRRKGKKNESSPDTKRGHLKPVQTVSQTRQLTITDWAKKKSHQTTTNQEEKEPAKSSQMQSSSKAKEMHLMVEKTCSKSQHTDSEEPEGSHLVPALEETEEVSSISNELNRSSEVAKESKEDPSVSQVKKSPARKRAKLQVKPVLSKRACTKSEGNTSTTDQPQPTRFTSPTRQHAQAAREKEESDNQTKLPVKEVTSTSSMEANSKSTESSSITSGPQSPISQDAWPRVVLPRVKLWTTEAGVCSASSTPTSSPARVSESVSPPVTPPQLKNSPTQSSSPTASENPDDDPSRVSQFFLCDIFTEVEEAE